VEIELCDFEADDAMPKGDWLWQVFEIVIVGIPTVLEVRFMSLFMSLGGTLLQGYVSINTFDPMTPQVDLLKVEVGI
jgi:hypothetical protein